MISLAGCSIFSAIASSSSSFPSFIILILLLLPCLPARACIELHFAHQLGL